MTVRATRGDTPPLHVMCERDVGLFSLIQQVISNIPWALNEGRVPVAYFGERCCYWTPRGYHDRNSVWEYYFEPVLPSYPAAGVGQEIVDAILKRFPSELDVGYQVGESFVTNHFGDHPVLAGKTLSVPYLWDDPNDNLRSRAEEIIERYVRPRTYIRDKVEDFFTENLSGQFNIGVQVRGTDALTDVRAHRKGSLSLRQYRAAIRRVLKRHPRARIFVATDSQGSLSHLKEHFGERVISYSSLRHTDGATAGRGPEGELMPAYIAEDRDRAALNGEEAVIDFLLLARCNFLIHNGSGLARTVLLKNKHISHINTHLERRIWVFAVRNAQRGVQAVRRWRRRVAAE